jgi:hypothetical protein
MAHATAARTAARNRDAAHYQRHRPEQTLLYRIVEQHYPVFVEHMAGQGPTPAERRASMSLKHSA